MKRRGAPAAVRALGHRLGELPAHLRDEGPGIGDCERHRLVDLPNLIRQFIDNRGAAAVRTYAQR
jgi:hypothetical protein